MPCCLCATWKAASWCGKDGWRKQTGRLLSNSKSLALPNPLLLSTCRAASVLCCVWEWSVVGRTGTQPLLQLQPSADATNLFARRKHLLRRVFLPHSLLSHFIVIELRGGGGKGWKPMMWLSDSHIACLWRPCGAAVWKQKHVQLNVNRMQYIFYMLVFSDCFTVFFCVDKLYIF